MLLVASISGLFKWRQFEPEVILLAVGWYLRFSLSYRGVEELLAERGLHADHVTVWRWVQRYAPALQRCLRRHQPIEGAVPRWSDQPSLFFSNDTPTIALLGALRIIGRGSAPHL
jgi:hypothetical protein